MNAPKINVTPLIDVLLGLLTIFMAVSPLKPSSFRATLANEADPRSPQEAHAAALVVTVKHDSTISLNRQTDLGTTGDTTPLTSRLADVFHERENNGMVDDSGRVVKTVFIKAPRSISYGEVARVVDAVKQDGAEPLSLQLDRLEQ